ncbi:MAG: putative vgr-related protein [Verrucomicrobiales bacterium]|nr:putative vgr-related protein [Verrucomicrobiales bacterium]
MILAHPVDTHVALGTKATFSVKVPQPANTTYQWQKAAPQSTVYSPIAGAVQATYTTAAVEASDFGSSYRVVVTSGTDVLTSRAGHLIVRPGQFLEIDGQAVIEAEHYTSKVDGSGGAPFLIVPDEAPFTAGGTNESYLNARADKFIQGQPDIGGNKGNDVSLVGTAPYVDYSVKITTVGEYQLYLRVIGWDGSSDSLYAELLSDNQRLPAPNPGWYRYGGLLPAVLPLDFSQLRNNPTDPTPVGWTGYAAPEHVDGTDADVPAVFTISNPGTYTVRLSQREDGTSVDTLILQLSSMTPPTDPGPSESGFEPAGSQGGSLPVLSVQISGNQLTVTWTNGGSLQEAASVAGSWSPVATGGTYSTPMNQAARFYRVAR